jgi:hypothetical protein
MKLADHLSKEQKQQMNKAKSPKKKRKRKKTISALEIGKISWEPGVILMKEGMEL